MLLPASGCKEAAEIRQYTVDSPLPPQETHRMLAAIVPEEKPPADKEKEPSATPKNDPAGAETKKSSPTQAWFFKLVGPIPQVEKVAAAFDQFVASIRTGKDRPEWTLPEGWKEDPAGRAPNFGREATIRIDQDGNELELTVSKLPMPPERSESWTLGNINRWRKQLQLPAIARSELDEYTQEIKTAASTAIKVDLRGASPESAMGTSMAAMNAHAAAGISTAAAASSPKTSAAPDSSSPSRAARPIPFDAEVPDGWKPGRMNEFRVAAFEIAGDGGARAAEMTVTPLGPSAGDLKANVDRWRSEIKLPETTSAELEEQTKTIDVNGQKADYVHLIGPEDAQPREATLGVILRQPDRVWFFKLRGEPGVVEREKPQFEEYVKSVQFK